MATLTPDRQGGHDDAANADDQCLQIHTYKMNVIMRLRKLCLHFMLRVKDYDSKLALYI